MRYINIKSFSAQFIYILIIYIVLFNPPLFFLLRPILLILILSICVFFLSKSNIRYLYKFRYFFTSLLLLVIYAFFREINTGLDVYFLRNINLLLEMLFIPFFLFHIYSKYIAKYNKSFFTYLFIASVVAISFSILMIVFPVFSEFVRYKLLVITEYTELLHFRNYGIAESLTFSYGVVLAFICSLQLYRKGLTPTLLLLFPFFCLSILSNSRTGLIVVFIFYILYLLKYLSIKHFILCSFLVIILIYCFSIYVDTLPELTKNWYYSFFYDISDYFFNTNLSSHKTISTLLDKMVILPESSSDILFGTGKDLYTGSFKTSDNGYILQLNYGGVMYLALLFSLYSSLWNLSFKITHDRCRFFCFIMLFMVLILNIKSYFFTGVGAFRVVTITIMYSVYVSQKKFVI